MRALEVLPYDVVLDGEVVVLDDAGLPRFQELQKRVQLTRASDLARAAAVRPATLYLFDLLGFEDFDLRALPLSSRKSLLQSILPRLGPLRFCDHVESEGQALFEEVRRRGLEGIIAKKADSPYREGRSRHWLKIKADKTGDFVVVGFSPDKPTRPGFGALQVAGWDGDRLVHLGGVGSGFSQKLLTSVRATLDAILVTRAPVEPKPLTPKGTRWVEPRLVCEVRYTHLTEDGTLRHPVFLRFRDDKSPSECVVPIESEIAHDEEREAPAAAVDVEKRVPFTNREKVYWPDEKYTKGDLVDYYRAISPYLLPYLRDRPVVLTRYPDGITGKMFYQHNAPKFIPGWLRTERFFDEESEKEIDYLVLEDEPSLLYAANLGAIPIHIWSSRASTIQRPDWCILISIPRPRRFCM